jgi:protein-S-isoprenylcysteine O-methyltransferase Ste14
MMAEILAFAAGTAVLVWLSRKPLSTPGRHGFYRFFAWEAILGLVVLNHKEWGEQPFSPHQMASWLLMLTSIFLVISAVRQLKGKGQANTERDDAALYEFEKTTQLVTSGIFRYIRHPMYASLMALAWGAYCQNPSWPGAAIAGFASICLLLTAKADETECLAYFGEPYAAYMKTTRRFIPYLI